MPLENTPTIKGNDRRPLVLLTGATGYVGGRLLNILEGSDLRLRCLLSQNERHDLLEVIEDRHGAHSTIITSQLPISSWHAYVNEPTVADALLDRLLASAHRLELKGDSLRKTRQKLTDGEHLK